MSTTQFLKDAGHTKHQLDRPEDLFNPTVALYFVCAYIDCLTKHKTAGKSEEFIVKGYHNGSMRADETPPEIWDIYLKARSQLLRLRNAMATSNDEEIIHVVQSGETLEGIGRICGVSVQAILDVNPDVKDDAVQAGDCIEIPVKKILPRLYAVKAGDTVAAIARRHDVSLVRLLGANADIKNPSLIKPGWLLSIPGLKGHSSDGRVRSDLISAAIEDGPFFLSSFADRYGMRMEEEMIPDAVAREHLRRHPHSRAAMRKLFGSHRRPSQK